MSDTNYQDSLLEDWHALQEEHESSRAVDNEGKTRIKIRGAVYEQVGSSWVRISA